MTTSNLSGLKNAFTNIVCTDDTFGKKLGIKYSFPKCLTERRGLGFDEHLYEMVVRIISNNFSVACSGRKEISKMPGGIGASTMDEFTILSWQYSSDTPDTSQLQCIKRLIPSHIRLTLSESHLVD